MENRTAMERELHELVAWMAGVSVTDTDDYARACERARELRKALGIPEIMVWTFTLPVYWASYLVNGDASGLSDEDQAACDAWLAFQHPGNCVDVGEPWFSRSNDANNLGGDVATFTFHRLED